jgi:hypothetical protein
MNFIKANEKDVSASKIRITTSANDPALIALLPLSKTRVTSSPSIQLPYLEETAALLAISFQAR